MKKMTILSSMMLIAISSFGYTDEFGREKNISQWVAENISENALTTILFVALLLGALLFGLSYVGFSKSLRIIAIIIAVTSLVIALLTPIFKIWLFSTIALYIGAALLLKQEYKDPPFEEKKLDDDEA